MAEGTDDEDKTEEPTAKKLREAREKGQVAHSREVNTWLILFAATLVLTLMARGIGHDLSIMLREFIARPHSFNMDTFSLFRLMGEILVQLAWIIGPALLIFFVVAGLSSFIQIGPLVSYESIKPKLEKLNPLKGAKRVFGSKAWLEFAKAFIKMMLVGVVTTLVLIPIFSDAPGMVGLYPAAMIDTMKEHARSLLISVLSILFVFAAIDYTIQRMQLNKQLRMSRQELKDEYKQTEGDPHIKARLRELRMRRARKRMMANVPKASVVITNPTHYAIALEYNQDKNGAPVVVAKGQDRIALKIREVAKENNVPIIENPPLARTMYDHVEIDQEIPEQHYKAVAEIISYVLSLKRR